MLNYLHSQWYRTVRRKYLYIALAAALALGALYLYLVRAAIGDRPIGLESGVEEIVSLTPYVGFYAILLINDGAFSDERRLGTFKNDISFGFSRETLYFGKLISCLVFCVLGMILLAVPVLGMGVLILWAYRKLMKKPDSIGDLSAVVTGILLAYTLPANCKWWLPIIGAFFAIVVVKQLYGGIGKNFLNPALAGRAFLLASYALFMTTWVVPSSLTSVIGADAATMATPLSYMKAGEALPQYFTYKSMFLGTMPGCLGEVSALALLIGGVYLLCRKVITWHIPVSFIGTVALLTLIFGSKNGGGYTHVEWMLDNLLSGGLLLGAFFMATDYSTSPVTAPGRIIYGVGCGALTVLIRVFGGFPEGVSFAILIMNCCAWMFDKHTQRRQFGVSREDVKAKKAAAKAAKKEAKEAAANG